MGHLRATAVLHKGLEEEFIAHLRRRQVNASRCSSGQGAQSGDVEIESIQSGDAWRVRQASADASEPSLASEHAFKYGHELPSAPSLERCFMRSERDLPEELFVLTC